MKIFLSILAALVILGSGAAILTGDDSPSLDSPQVQAENNGRYITIDQFRSNPERYNDRRLVYFFHANWCPTCRALENSITSNINSVPSDVTIIKTDFDDSNSLRQEFEVRVQHTLVQIRDDRSVAGKWVGQPNVQSVLAALQEV